MGNTVTRIPEEANNYNYRPAMLWEKKAYQTVMDYRNQKLEPRTRNKIERARGSRKSTREGRKHLILKKEIKIQYVTNKKKIFLFGLRYF